VSVRIVFDVSARWLAQVALSNALGLLDKA